MSARRQLNGANKLPFRALRYPFFLLVSVGLILYFSVFSTGFSTFHYFTTMQHGQLAFRQTSLENGVFHYTFEVDQVPGSFQTAMELLANGDTAMVDALAGAIKGSGHPAVFWECTPITPANFESSCFEFMVLPSPELARISRPDPSPFEEFFSEPCDAHSVVSFDNLGANAKLIAPCPPIEGSKSSMSSNMAHLMSFLDTAPAPTVHVLWQRVGQQVLKEMKMLRQSLTASVDTPRWLSTSGLGVSWLHIRLDQRPKYYTWTPYKTPPSS